MKTSACAILLYAVIQWFAVGGHARAQGDCDCSVADQPVCGANGRTYGNACLATCRGQAVLYSGECRWKRVDQQLESPHPCSNDYQESWQIAAPEPAAALRLNFQYVALQRGHDVLEIVANARPVARLTGLRFAFSIQVPAGTADMTLITDACFFTSTSRSQSSYLTGHLPNSDSLIAWDQCHIEPTP